MKAWRSLRVRLIFSYVALALLLLTFSGYIFSNALSWYAISVQRSQQALYARQALRVLGEAQKRSLSGDETLALLRQNLPGVRIELETVAPEKEIVPAEPKIFMSPEQAAPPDGKVLTLPSQVETSILRPGKIGLLYITKPGEISFTLPTVTVTQGVSSATLYRFTMSPSAFTALSNLYRQVLEVLFLALTLAILIGWLLSHWLARPLSRLVAATEAVAGGNFLETVDRSGIIELDRLGEQFNRMVLYLRESFRSLAAERDTAQRFAADAAHELKTPVTTLRAHHELITENHERLQQVLPAFGRQIERMEKIIAGLLQLANLGESSGLVLQPADLRKAIRNLEPAYQALAEDSGHCLTTACPDNSVTVLLDQRLLELALNNLVDNASKYTPPGGQIALTLQVDDCRAVITVRDTGKGIAPEELPFIFERFQRGIDTQSIPGTGLGLAIAREAVQRLDGTITAGSEVGRGTWFEIRLPLLPTQ
ncbi:Signal transduction histidine kinase [Desulfotomaculum arcticum]|uniref:histidine kinase n=1 Tax=Desulfotruncus arcticus DSM 17038 TaxID=1121424 RepID=A0A1I2R1M6_9FIRM|nr:HAMP domain-containing sensor histidine kinase [Desulfotruncus arcticus]SFG34452.1 Signal transduction histidine kinase [Desulfotomaculum arcticum] [Desulfotruncus arcticus DSM 17038]